MGDRKVNRSHKISKLPIVHYQSYWELSLEPIIILSNGSVAYVNQAGVHMIGAGQPGDVIGRPLPDFIHPDCRVNMLAQIETHLKEGKPAKELMEMKWIRLDGLSITVEVRAVRVLYRGVPSVELICRDITERKRVEEMLRESEQRYRRLLQYSPDAIVVHSDGIIIYANNALLDMFRAEHPNQIVGRTIFEFIHPDSHENAIQRLSMIDRNKNLYSFHEHKFVRLDGDVFTGEAASTDVYHWLDKTVFQTVVRDLSERQKREEFTRQSEKLSALGQLAAGVAHEIRNPLTALMGFTRLLQSKHEENAPYCEIMQVELKRINSIIDEFLQLSKPRLTSFQEHEVHQLLDNLIAVLQTQAILNNVEISLEYSEHPLKILCDEYQLKQVFVNVIKNAIEAMPFGGTLKISTLHKHGRTVLCFKDEGVGIPKEHLNKIGDPFFTTKGTGTGLGLSVSYKIIEAHHGEMYFESEIGSGTSVYITIPLARELQGSFG